MRINTAAAVLAAIVFSAAAIAETPPAGVPNPPPKFVPFTVTQQDYDAVRSWLFDQPTKFALPVLQWLEKQEIEATEKAKKPDASAPHP